MIRAVTPDDAPAVAALALSSGLFSIEDVKIVQELMSSYFGGKNGEGHTCVIDDDDQAVAVAYYEPATAADRTWYLTMIAVRGDRQGHGRGTTLLRHVENDLRRRGQRLLLAETSGVAAFARTRAFYATCGYHEEARVRDYYAPGDDMVLFRGDLVAMSPTSLAQPRRPADSSREDRTFDAASLPIRSARAVDLDDLEELAIAFYAEEGFTTFADDLRHNLRVLLDSDAARTAVIDLDRQLIAFAITTTSFGLENGQIAELQDLFVRPQMRRHGLAERLLDDSAAWAASKGCHQLEVVVAPQGSDVSHLRDYYRARGFQDHGRQLLSRRLRPPIAP